MKRLILLSALMAFNTHAAWETYEKNTRVGKGSLLLAKGEYSLIQMECFDRLKGQFRLDITTSLNLGEIPARDTSAIVIFYIDNHPKLRYDNVTILLGDNRKLVYITMHNQARYLDRLISDMQMAKTLKFEIYYGGNVVRDTVDMSLFMKHYLGADCFSGEQNYQTFKDRE